MALTEEQKKELREIIEKKTLWKIIEGKDKDKIVAVVTYDLETFIEQLISEAESRAETKVVTAIYDYAEKHGLMSMWIDEALSQVSSENNQNG